MGRSPLSPVWVVSLTGHRQLKEPGAIGSAIREQVEALRAEVRGEIAGCSSAAIGADTLFAEICQSLQIPWIVLLPFSPTEFQSDFSESQWSHTVELLRHAIDIEISSSADDRTAAYLRCGVRTVDESDVLIAVWDGKPARGVGGTADVVGYARLQKKPLVLIDPASLKVQRESFPPAGFVDPEFEFFDRVTARNVTSTGGTTDKQRVEQFYAQVDSLATRIAPRFRRWVAASLLMNTAAVALTAAMIGLGLSSSLLDLTAVFLVAAATLLIVYVKRRETHHTWMRCRVAAEMCRSALATWDFPDANLPFWFQELPGFARLARSLRLVKLENPQAKTGDVAVLRERYLRERIDDQIAYFTKRSRTLHWVLLILSSLFWIFSLLAIGRGIFVATAGVRCFSPNVGRVVSSFLPFALPLAAGCAFSLISIFDLHRQRARSLQMKTRLTAARDEILHCENIVTLQNAVEKAEKLAAEEFLEWFVLFQLPRFQ